MSNIGFVKGGILKCGSGKFLDFEEFIFLDFN
jgi:hypothetical protein